MTFDGDQMRAADRGEDGLAPARGVILGSVVGAVMWGAVAVGVLAIFGCASPAPDFVAARESCRDWLHALPMKSRPEMGSAQWGLAIRECAKQRLSAAGRVAVALDEAAR